MEEYVKLSCSGKKKKGKLEEKKEDITERSSAIKLNHIPYGFFEYQIRDYFRQFGKTGNHKGWAFILFADPDVAQIAADAMNGYLMFDKCLQCRVLKKDEVPNSLKRGPCIGRRVVPFKRARLHAEIVNKPKSDAQKKRCIKNLSRKLSRRLEKLKEMGIDYSYKLQEEMKVAEKQSELKKKAKRESS